MAPVNLVFFREASGKAPVVQWLEDLRRGDRKALMKCVAAIKRLAACGHELRRPIADYLREDIYELRIKCRHVNFRVFYFFHGRTVAVLTNGLAKEGAVPAEEIDRAIRRREMFRSNPELYTYEEPENSWLH